MSKKIKKYEIIGPSKVKNTIGNEMFLANIIKNKKNTKKMKNQIHTSSKNDPFIRQSYFDNAVKDFVTKKDLDNALKNFVTKDDLNNALKNFVTKDDLKNEFRKFEIRFEKRLLGKLAPLLNK